MSDTTICQRQVLRFLGMMEAMSPESRQSFRKIYSLAPRRGNVFAKGSHVRLAMTEAVLHPQIAAWVRINLAVRVGLKFAKVTGRKTQVQRLDDLLEAFHIAADAFVLDLSIEKAMQRRAQQFRRGKNILSLPQRNLAVGEWISPEELTQIQAFKQQVIPGFIGSLRQKQQLMVEGD